MPNPIKFNAERKGEMHVSAFNSGGQLVLKTKMVAFYGLNSGHLHIFYLAKGTYNIIFNLACKKEIKKVVTV